MNVNKRLFVPLVLSLGLVPSAMAQKMQFFFNNGEPIKEFRLEDIGKVYFDGGSLLVQQSDGASVSAFDLLTVQTIKFGTLSGVESAVKDEAAAVKVAVDGDLLKVIGYDAAAPQPASFYNVNGALLYASASLQEDAIDISALPKGIYIFKLGNKTYKICK